MTKSKKTTNDCIMFFDITFDWLKFKNTVKTLYSEHLPTLNNEHDFWSLQHGKPLYSEHTCNKIYARVWNKRTRRTFLSSARPISQRSIHQKKIRHTYRTKGTMWLNSLRRVDRLHVQEKRTFLIYDCEIMVCWADWNTTHALWGNEDSQATVPSSYYSTSTTTFSCLSAGFEPQSTLHQLESSQADNNQRFLS